VHLSTIVIGDVAKPRPAHALLTYEKFSAIALTDPHVLEQVGTIVIDEVQMIADESRGANLEFILTLLRMRRRDGLEPQLIALSAVIGDTNGLERWLGGRLLRRVERPVPLNEGVLCSNGTFRYFDGDNGQERRADRFIQPYLATASTAMGHSASAQAYPGRQAGHRFPGYNGGNPLRG
jgi:helicase